MAERKSQPQSNAGRSLMDVDFDFDRFDSWPFDPIALFSSSYSLSLPPSQPLVHLSFPNPPSPLWWFDDGAAAAAAAPEVLNPVADKYDTTTGNINQDDGKTRKPEPSAAEDSSDEYRLIRERMTLALRYFKESTDQHVLVQVWAPIKDGNRYVLTTSGQPFVLDPQSLGLLQYRTVSMTYMFSADGDNDVDLGLPGRVFRRKMPEWTPDVQFYSSKEYSRLNHARHYDVRGTLALPVFEPSAQSCVGVVELIMTSQKINYATEVDKVCKALEAVNLRSYEILDSPSIQICNEGRHTVLAEILEILTTVCEAFKLPLAQTWIPCMHRSVLAQGGGSQKSCSSFDGSCMGQVCMSTSDVAFYVIDGHMWLFRDACVEHHLQKGQGVAGRAFESRISCFTQDITQFCKAEYPVVHYARLFGLAGCLAVCLQSAHTGSDDYVLEFFLPPDCKDPGDQQVLLDSMSTLMKKCFRSLKMTDNTQGKSPYVVDLHADNNLDQESGHVCFPSCSAHVLTNSPESNPVNDKNVSCGLVKVISVERNSSGTVTSSVNVGEKKLERKRGKAEKSISLDVLQQYFCGSLKDAAKALGVCPTTMKRICRHHGISRWPSRKINKVNRSLSKLKRVIESVQGAEGQFNMPSLACQLPLAVSLEGCKHGTKLPNIRLDELAKIDSLPHKSPHTDDGCNNIVSQYENVTNSPQDFDIDSSKSSSSGEGNMDAPTQESWEEVNRVDTSRFRKDLSINGSLGFDNSLPEATITKPQPMLCEILIEDLGSSKDLKTLFNCVVDRCQDINAVSYTSYHPPHVQDSRIVTIKANYKEDIIRFRLPASAVMEQLHDEVAKRLKLEVGTFDIRYADDDQDWVKLSCNADLKECMEITRSSGLHVIRLSIHDVVSFFGSSVGSSD